MTIQYTKEYRMTVVNTNTPSDATNMKIFKYMTTILHKIGEIFDHIYPNNDTELRDVEANEIPERG